MMNELVHDTDNEGELDLMAGEAETEGPGLYVGVSGKQPNFLQKLYE